jgi:peptidoglycan/LPS O-acetylase OafA/YrhL
MSTLSVGVSTGKATLPFTRITQLDGIRGIAIILVFAAHSISFESGWIGVDIFFVLSGYLITGILRRDRNNERGFWAGFYIKRATRILPPLALCFAGTALLFTIDWHRLWYYYVFFAANIGETLYRGQSETLGVLWSLAVEEHFYLLWPLAVRFLTRKHLIWVLTAIVTGEPIFRAASTPWMTSFWPIYFLTPFRLDGLAAGSLLAIMLERDRTRKWIALQSRRSLYGSSLILGAVFLGGGLGL